MRAEATSACTLALRPLQCRLNFNAAGLSSISVLHLRRLHANAHAGLSSWTVLLTAAFRLLRVVRLPASHVASWQGAGPSAMKEIEEGGTLFQEGNGRGV